MPNWCENRLVVRGEQDELNRMVEQIKSEERLLDFNKILPYPARFQEQDNEVEALRNSGVAWEDIPKDGYNSGGYEWCIENWGTKWNAVEATIDEDYDITYFFDTAWSPPIPVIHELSRQFPELYFELTFGDPAMDFSGVYEFKDGHFMREDDGGYQEFGLYVDEWLEDMERWNEEEQTE